MGTPARVTDVCVCVTEKERERDNMLIQVVPGVKAPTSGFNSRVDCESKTSYTHMGPIRNGSGVMSFLSIINKLEWKEEY
jgi:hypothetical protein